MVLVFVFVEVVLDRLKPYYFITFTAFIWLAYYQNEWCRLSISQKPTVVGVKLSATGGPLQETDSVAPFAGTTRMGLLPCFRVARMN